MTWFLLALAGSFLVAIYWSLLKKFLKDIDQFALSGGVFLSSSLFLFIFSTVNGIPILGGLFFFALTGTSLLNIVANILNFYVIKTCDLSISVPMLSFTPVFLIATSYLILDEKTSPMGIAGIILIVTGCIFIETGEKCKEKKWSWKKGEMLMLVVSFIFSISSNLDKMLINNSDKTFGAACVFFIMGIFFSALSGLKNKDTVKIYKENISSFTILGFISFAATVLLNTALKMQTVPYVIAVKRLSILFSVLYGGIFLKEAHPVRRTMGAGIMVAGAIIIALS